MNIQEASQCTLESFPEVVLDRDNYSQEQLRNEQQELFTILIDRENEFGFNPDVAVHYPAEVADVLIDPEGYLKQRIDMVEARRDQKLARSVVLTTYSALKGPLIAAGYQERVIDMPAGPEGTSWYWRELSPYGVGSFYLEAVDEMDEKIQPSFVVKLNDERGHLLAGMSGSVWEHNGERYAYISTVVARRDAPAGVGGRVAERVWKYLRDQGVKKAHLGTQTADQFYKRHGFQVIHTIVPELRFRQHKDGPIIWCDLVIMEKSFQSEGIG